MDAEKPSPQTLVYSTRSNQLKLMDKSLWNLLERNKLEDIPQPIIDELLKDKIIVAKEENERQIILQENSQAIADSTNLYMSIQPTANCPLGCGYCGQKHESKNMKVDVQDATIDRIRRKMAQKTYKSLGITWFGGEPLSGFSAIRRLSPQILDIVNEYNLHYHAKIVTNGLLLTPPITEELIQKHQVKDFEITLDGIGSFHDQRRHTKAGGETFDKIYEHVLELSRNKEANITIRCNVDYRNKDGVVPLMDKLVSDDLQKRVRFYVAPIHSWGNDAHLLSAEKSDFAQWEIDWLIDMEQRGFNVRPLPKRNNSVCFTVHPDNELIDPFGGVFSCSEVSLVPSYETNGKNIHSLGSVKEAPLTHADSPWGNFYEEKTVAQYGCGTCRILPTCGGACPKEWSEGRIPCPPTKINIPQRILLAYVQKKKAGLEAPNKQLEAA